MNGFSGAPVEQNRVLALIGENLEPDNIDKQVALGIQIGHEHEPVTELSAHERLLETLTGMG
jgi:hypothetical protein